MLPLALPSRVQSAVVPSISARPVLFHGPRRLAAAPVSSVVSRPNSQQQQHVSLLVARATSNADASTSRQLPPQLQEPKDPSAYCIANFYHLVDLGTPQEAQAVTEKHRKWIHEQGFDLRGRIYVSPQGINAQYGGTVAESKAYAEWLKSQPEFAGLRYTLWPADEHSFPKLRLKYKPNLISLAGGMQNFPITDPSQRATPLEPADWKRMIAEAKEKKIVVLDVRNDYEWDAGHFEGAERPKEEIFAETPVGEEGNDVPDYLREIDPDAPVMMYCTGGIRCDVYSAFLRQKGYNNLYTLHGGIQNYLRHEGGDHWKGSLFVFDGRMAIPAAGSESDADSDAAPGTAGAGALPAAVPCRLCGSPDSQLPHMNCANIDCNELFVSCAACKPRFAGCCCEACMTAPRLLRPAKMEGGHYGNWGNYADAPAAAPLIHAGRTEGRAARRARRREALADKRMAVIEEKLSRKAMIKEATARMEAAEAAAGPTVDGASSAAAQRARLLQAKAKAAEGMALAA